MKTLRGPWLSSAARIGRVSADPPTRLARRLGLADAVVVGLGAMVGAGVFSAWSPAAAAGAGALLSGLGVAAVVAFCNATSSARLAARYPEAGGAYVYGRRRLGHAAGYLAGWSFVVGKLASCAAMALTVGSYAVPGAARPLAAAAVVAVAGVNLGGITKTALATRLILAAVLASLAVFVAAALAGGTVDATRLGGFAGSGAREVLQAAGFLFFAFAGYARLATLGEEVRDPARTIPRAILAALGLVLLVYAAVGTTALAAAGAPLLAATDAPLRAVLDAGSLSELSVVVRVGAAIAALGALLSLLAGVSRTAFAMAAAGDLPSPLAAVHGERRVPHVAELVAAAVVVALVLTADIRGAIGFSSFCVLLYYAIANLAALTLRGSRRGAVVAGTGLVGCIALATALPVPSLLAGLAVVGAGVLAFLGSVRRRTVSSR